MSISLQDVEALRGLLADLPQHQARQVTKQEAVALLAREIRAAQRRGYPPEEIARLLSERGLPINGATLRGYLRTARKPRKSARAAKPAPRADPPATKGATGPAVAAIAALGKGDCIPATRGAADNVATTALPNGLSPTRR